MDELLLIIIWSCLHWNIVVVVIVLTIGREVLAVIWAILVVVILGIVWFLILVSILLSRLWAGRRIPIRYIRLLRHKGLVRLLR